MSIETQANERNATPAAAAAPQPSQKYFYVVGGEYADLTFENLLTKTSQFRGPFETREDAQAEWRKLSNVSTGDALVRFEIIEIFHKIDTMQLFGLAAAN